MSLNRNLLCVASPAVCLLFLVLIFQMATGGRGGVDLALGGSSEGYPTLTKFARPNDPRLPTPLTGEMASEVASMNPQMAKQLLDEYRKSNNPAFDWRQSEKAQAQRVMAAVRILQNVLGASSPELLVALPKGLQDVLFRSAITAVANQDPNPQRVQSVLRSARNLGYLKPGMVQRNLGSQAQQGSAASLQMAKLRKHLLLNQIATQTSSDNSTSANTDHVVASSFLVNDHPRLDRALEQDDRIALDWMIILLVLHMFPRVRARTEWIIHSARGEKQNFVSDPSKVMVPDETPGVLDAVITGGKEFVEKDLVEGLGEMAGEALAFAEFWEVGSTDESLDVIISYDSSSDGIFGEVLANAIFEEYTNLDFAALLLPSDEDTQEGEAQARTMKSVAGCKLFIALISDEWIRKDQNIKLLSIAMHCIEAHHGNRIFLVLDQKMKYQNEIHSRGIKLSSANIQRVVRVLQKRGFLDHHAQVTSPPLDPHSDAIDSVGITSRCFQRGGVEEHSVRGGAIRGEAGAKREKQLKLSRLFCDLRLPDERVSSRSTHFLLIRQSVIATAGSRGGETDGGWSRGTSSSFSSFAHVLMIACRQHGSHRLQLLSCRPSLAHRSGLPPRAESPAILFFLLSIICTNQRNKFEQVRQTRPPAPAASQRACRPLGSFIKSD
eukprot:753571-Hanusia_phi.AAC.12